MFDRVLNISLSKMNQRHIQNPVEHLQWSFFAKKSFLKRSSMVIVWLCSKYASVNDHYTATYLDFRELRRKIFSYKHVWMAYHGLFTMQNVIVMYLSIVLDIQLSGGVHSKFFKDFQFFINLG